MAEAYAEDEQKQSAISSEALRRILLFQQNEITEFHLYRWLAQRAKDEKNREVFGRLAADEKRHCDEWKKYSRQDVAPARLKMLWFRALTRIFGFTFAIKLMEAGEDDSGEAYRAVRDIVPDVERIAKEEDEHERVLMELLDEERLRYAGSIVLGLNDALVELTGALAGLTLALRNTRLIALTGTITGLAAALSMAASEYLSTKTEGANQHPVKAASYTGITYLVTVVLLVSPYLLFTNYYAALAGTLLLAVGIIAVFNYYIAVARDLPFRPRFLEMAILSLSVAGLSFFIGIAMRKLLGVEV